MAYTTSMSLLVQSTSAPTPKTKSIRSVSLAFACVLILMAVAQLFTFEKFPDVIAGFWLPGGLPLPHILAALFVIGEVIALPFLLFMRLSPAMRIVSMMAGWLVVAAWLAVSLWQNVTMNSTIANNGLLGATVSLPVGWWSVLVCIAFGILAVWTSWGMWPYGHSKKHI